MGAPTDEPEVNVQQRSRQRLSLLLAIFLFVFLACAVALRSDDRIPVPPMPPGEPYAASAQNRAAAKEAFEEIDALLKEASKLSGLAIKQPVKSEVVSRDQVMRYIKQRMSDTTDNAHFHIQEVAYKRIGLIPRDYPLKSSVEQLLTEQAAAYYDPREKTIYIADWTPIELQRPAIVHELVHALQDQYINLDAFLDDKKIDEDEQTARDAVIEGQGTFAMMQYMLAKSGLDIDSIGNIEELMSQATMAEVGQFPVFKSAPMYLKESLLFPYTRGLQFARWHRDKDGKVDFGVALKNPPRTTAEILHPGTGPAARLDTLKAPALDSVPAGYKFLGDGVMGELDLKVLLKQYAGDQVAASLAPAWRGFRYGVYENGKTSGVILLHRSRWKDAQAAEQFAAEYRKIVAARKDADVKIETNADTVTVREGVPGN